MYKKDSETVLETFEFPLKAFGEINREFDLQKIKQIIFKFDCGPEGVIYVDEIGFRNEPGAL